MQKEKKLSYPFLEGAGEMGELTRNFDWSNTSIGSPDTWPQGLRTALSILLNSKFPMFLFWGDDLVCFYNDAFRPSLGVDGKHPHALGQKGKDVWPEIWSIIYPLLEQVLTAGQATWSENQLIPIYRNGRIENVYWTFSYSPVRDDVGKISGVFVTCVETTEQIVNIQRLEESQEKYHGLFQSMDQGFCVLQMIFDDEGQPVDYMFMESNPAFVEQTGLVNAVGRTARELVPGLESHWFDLYGKVAITGEAIRFEQGSEAMGRWFDVYAYRTGKPEETKVALLFTDITARKVAEDKIRKSEQNLRNTILQAPVAMCIFKGPAFVVEIANERMLQLWGTNADNVIGKPVFDGLPEAREEKFEQLMGHVLTTGETVKAYGVPVRLMRKGNIENVYVDFVYEAYREQDGSISGVLAVAVDVTESVMSRKKIEEAEERSRLSIEAAELGTFDVDVHTNEMLISSRGQEIFDVDDSMNRETFVSRFVKEDLPIRDAAYKRAYETGSLDYEGRVRWRDGSIHWIRAKGIVSFDDNKKPVKIIGVIQDITEQKRFAEELQKQVAQRTAELEAARSSLIEINEYLQSIINKFDSGLASLVPIFEGNEIVDFYFRMTNVAYTKFTKFTTQEIVGQKVSELFPGYYLTDAFERYKQTYVTGKPDNWELHYNVDNLNVHLQVSADKMGDEVVVNLTDFTELKNLQLDLQKKVRELEISNEELQQFAHVASHDLKEPVRKIRTFGNRLISEFSTSLPEKAGVYLNKIESAATRIYAMIDGVLLYSSLNALSLRAEKVDLNGIIEDIEDDLELVIQQKNARINRDTLPVIEGSRVLLYQLFYNLVNNSLKFTNSTPLIEIRFNGEKKNILSGIERDYIVIEVADNGIGFNQEHAKNIFETFVRLNAKDSFEGTGLGLALCKKIVQRHEGIISAKGQLGKGAVFTIELPKKQV